MDIQYYSNRDGRLDILPQRYGFSGRQNAVNITISGKTFSDLSK